MSSVAGEQMPKAKTIELRDKHIGWVPSRQIFPTSSVSINNSNFAIQQQVMPTVLQVRPAENRTWQRSIHVRWARDALSRLHQQCCHRWVWRSLHRIKIFHFRFRRAKFNFGAMNASLSLLSHFSYYREIFFFLPFFVCCVQNEAKRKWMNRTWGKWSIKNTSELLSDSMEKRLPGEFNSQIFVGKTTLHSSM